MPSDLQITNIKDQANANSAITIASDGQITVNQNNPTITLGSNTTFPTGHIIQVVSTNQTAGRTTVTATSFNTDDVFGSLVITPKKASSNILLTASVTAQTNTTGGYIYLDFYKNASDVTETVNLSGMTYGVSANDDDKWISIPMIFLDTCSENSLSEKTYKITAYLNATSGTGYLGWRPSSDYFNNITAYEIAT